MTRRYGHSRIVSVRKVALAELRRIHFTLGGKPCTEEAWYQCYALFWCMCSELLNWSETECRKMIGRCSNSKEQSIEDIISTLTLMDEHTVRQWELQGKQSPWNDFKGRMREVVAVPELVYLFKPVYSCVYLREQGDYETYRKMRSCWCFMSRITLRGNIKDLTNDVFISWKTVDASLPDTVDSGPAEFFRRYVDSWKLSSLNVADARFSNGSCADAGPCLYEKYMQVGRDSRTDYLARHYGIELYAPQAALGLQFEDKLSAYGMHHRQRQLRVSLATTVPKNYAKRRGINMEPAHLTALQQCVKESLYNYIETHEHLGKHISFAHANYNAELAQVASEFGYYATIDISSASDRISKTMLRSWLSRSDLYRAWLLTKSDAVAFKNDDKVSFSVWQPKRAFSMGSAVCFPIETLCYAAMVETALEKSGIDPAESAYRVYGDDIILETDAADALIELLTRNGCEVNLKKTFKAKGLHIFRESCGGEFLDGVDVTPVRVSRKFSVEEPLKVFADFQDLCNRCYTLFPGTRAAMISEVLSLGFLPRFTDSEQGHWCSFTASNFHLPVLTDEDLQEAFAYYDTTTCRVSHEQVSDHMYLYEILRRMEKRAETLEPWQEIDEDNIVLGNRLPWYGSNQEIETVELSLAKAPWVECRLGL